MKHLLLVLSLFLFIHLYAHDAQLDAVQSRVVERVPYLKNTIEAYNSRLAVDQQPVHAINDLVSLLYRVYDEFDPVSYQAELLEKYGATPDVEKAQSALAKMVQVDKSADRINDGGGDCWSVASAQSQNSELILAVWQDERNGVDDPDIYGQFFNLNLEPIGSNFVVHTYNGGIAQNHPVVAALSDGGFIVVWEDYRHGNSAIYARRFNANRSADGGEFQVDVNAGAQLKPAVSAGGNGQFTITWLQNGGNDYNVYVRIYTNNKSALTPTFLINDNKDAFQWFPVCASAESGESLLVWEDKRNGNSDIYAQRLRADGSKRAGNFQVDDAVGTSTQWQPDVTAGAGQFVVAWEDFRDNPGGIYAQWFDASLLTQGDNLRVDDYLVESVKELPAAAINNAGETAFCWQDSRNSTFHIYAQTFNANKDAEIVIPLVDGDAEQNFPQMLMNGRLLSFFWIQKDADDQNSFVAAEHLLWTDVPVELSAFRLALHHETVECTWQTLSESNNLGFAIERSVDGVSFEQIGFVDGYGTTSQKHTYSFVDTTPLDGDNFYRLKQVDFDGTASYSETQHIAVTLPTLPVLLSNYPNPFNPATTIFYQLDKADHVVVEIYDVHGRLVAMPVNMRQARGQHEFHWDARDARGHSLASGVYFCKLTVSNAQSVKKMLLAK